MIARLRHRLRSTTLTLRVRVCHLLVTHWPFLDINGFASTTGLYRLIGQPQDSYRNLFRISSTRTGPINWYLNLGGAYPRLRAG